jgi:histone acetyltransferase (RNA polymerase elongator complex component)
MKERWQVALDVRAREIKDKTNDPTKAILHEIDYDASKWKEHFLTFEDPADRTIFSLLRLRIPSQYFTKEKHFIKELEWCAIIRELHTFWDQLWIWEKWSTFWQHIWFWKRLVTRAEEIAKSYWINKIAVISWVWVRAYYEKRWYKLSWEYMIKTLD